MLLSSSYEYPGRYSEWTLGFVDPPLCVETWARRLREWGTMGPRHLYWTGGWAPSLVLAPRRVSCPLSAGLRSYSVALFCVSVGILCVCVCVSVLSLGPRVGLAPTSCGCLAGLGSRGGAKANVPKIGSGSTPDRRRRSWRTQMLQRYHGLRHRRWRPHGSRRSDGLQRSHGWRRSHCSDIMRGGNPTSPSGTFQGRRHSRQCKPVQARSMFASVVPL